MGRAMAATNRKTCAQLSASGRERSRVCVYRTQFAADAPRSQQMLMQCAMLCRATQDEKMSVDLRFEFQIVVTPSIECGGGNAVCVCVRACGSGQMSQLKHGTSVGRDKE